MHSKKVCANAMLHVCNMALVGPMVLNAQNCVGYNVCQRSLIATDSTVIPGDDDLLMLRF